MLAKTPRLRIWIGGQEITAWSGSTHKVCVALPKIPEVCVDFGAKTARARVKVWKHGKQRTSRGLDASNAAKLIEQTLCSGSRIEVDADNLGRVQIVITHAPTVIPSDSVSRRLAWHDHILGRRSHSNEPATPSFLQHPRNAKSLTYRTVIPAVLVRSRLALRQGRKSRGTGQ
jgi:hypothetical protein